MRVCIVARGKQHDWATIDTAQRLYAQGCSSHEVGERLGVSYRTVQRWAQLQPPDSGDTSWVADGLCGQIGAAWDFVTPRQAERICHRCPVYTQCHTYSLNNPDLHGIWAGMTRRQRTRP